MSSSTLEAMKFGCLTSTKPAKRFSSGVCAYDFKLVSTAMYWSPYQICSLSFKENKTVIELFTKTHTKVLLWS